MLNTPESIKETKTTKGIRKENSNTNQILKDIKLLFEPVPITEDKTIKDTRKENFYTDKILKDIKTLFEPEEAVRTGNALSSNFTEYESNGDKDKKLSVKEFLNKIKPCLNNIIQLTTAINFMSSKDSTETRAMHSTSDNIEIMIGSETDEIIVEFFESFLQKYQKGSEQPMKGSEFIFDSVDLLHYKFHK